MERIKIKDEYITLNQLLKMINYFESGGMIKAYIQNEGIFVNEKLEFRRGKKLYHNDVVQIKDGETFVIQSMLFVSNQ